MQTILFSLPGNEDMAGRITAQLKVETGLLNIRHFPDGESYVRILSDVKDKVVLIVCTLNNPDGKFLPLLFTAQNAKSLGAKSVLLIAPYLSYMRQDKVFLPGEALTTAYFAQLISSVADGLITIDPHLHRIHDLAEIYSIPTKVIHAADTISNWIKENISKPLLVGPDEESRQWVSAVAQNAAAPFIVLNKVRHGDRDVRITVPDVDNYKDYTPVLVDDIISTARTMITTTKHLLTAGMKPPVCIGVHPIFADDAYQDLLNAGVEKVVTCNTIPHESNGIDLSHLLVNFSDLT